MPTPGLPHIAPSLPEVAAGIELEALQLSEMRYKRLFESARDGILMLDGNTGQIEDVNPCLIEMLGFSHAELLGKKLWDAGPFADVARWKQILLDLQTIGHVRHDGLALITKAGIQLQVEFLGTANDSGGIRVIQCNFRDVTERERSEASLRERELQYRSLFENMLEGYAYCQAIFEQDQLRDFVYLQTNSGFENLTGLKDVVGKKVSEVIPGLRESNPDLFRIYGRVALSGRPEKFETYIEPVGIWLSIAVYSAEREHFVAVFDNITTRKLAEEALRSSEADFRTLAEAVPQIVWITRPDGSNIYFNKQWMNYTGLTREESLGHGWNRPFHPDDQRQAADAWQKATTNIGTYSLESRIRRADGIYRWWLVRGVPLQDAAGNVLKWFGTCTDIHDLKTAELDISRTNQALRESERRFTDLLENVELVSLMLDRDGKITYCNDYLLRMTGWQREEVFGREWIKLFVPPEHAVLMDTFTSLLANRPEAWHHENEILTRAGGRRLIRWNNSLLRSATGEVTGTASIGEDITERKESADRIVHLNRVYAMLSGINSLIIRVRDRDELFREACRIAVEVGGFHMALIGLVNPRTRLIEPVASAGKSEEILTAIKRLVSSREIAGTSMVGRALSEKRAVVANDSQSDPQVLLRDKYTQAGVRSIAVLPLLVADDAVGAFALYASEREFFHEGEMKLLADLNDDIAFAIDYIDKRDRLKYIAFYDGLTGLANRSLFIERVAQNLRSAAVARSQLAVGVLDLERFKNVNHSLGRPAGDALLKQVADWLTRNLGDASLLARVDADHFAFVLTDIKHERDVPRLVEKAMGEFAKHPFVLDEAVFRVAARIGVAIFPDDGATAEILFKNAEIAVMKAKVSGDRYMLFAQKMGDTMVLRASLESQLRDAIDKEEFVLHYQPKINLLSGKLTGAEALIRWNDPQTGLVPPMRFIPILEETGLIFEVGRWALHKAIEDYLRWRAAGLPAVRIAVNVSPLQLRNRGFIDEIRGAIGINAEAAAGLELEITETMIMTDLEHSIATLQEIRDLGVDIAIDDFGTGFSSLKYLAKLPIDTLKIDRSFIVDMTSGPSGLALVSTIINLGQALNLKLVAEGVETEEEARLLRLLRCDEMQGFLFGRPVPGDAFEAAFLLPAAAA
jgi:diguanylate cyclase (GGDEF)-like protein/PAS domain S-box-containing protein